MGECTLEFIKNAADRCAYVTEACADNYEYIDYYRMHYCVFNEGLYFTIPILLIVLYILFYLISDTTNRYLSPALTILSDKLGMSQNLAGVTFLALGNGAPDVISSIVGSEDDSLVFALGALIGAGVFVTTVVFSTVVFFSGKIKVNKKLFIRDIALYLFSIIILNIFGYNGSVNIYEAIGFFSLYVM
jgi:sodium/potassium/calcium exchanger 6